MLTCRMSVNGFKVKFTITYTCNSKNSTIELYSIVLQRTVFFNDLENKEKIKTNLIDWRLNSYEIDYMLEEMYNLASSPEWEFAYSYAFSVKC